MSWLNRDQSPSFKLLGMFVFGFAAAMLWRNFLQVAYFRPVQYLESRDRRHHALLERGGNLDLNFRVWLDGERIYWSPDFAPKRDVSFRETLLWDDSGDKLILEVAGRRLFGYQVSQHHALSNAELLQAKVAPPDADHLGFEGKWPDAARSAPRP